MTTAPALLYDEATALLDRLGLPMLFLDAGMVSVGGSYAQGWMRSRLLTADLRLSSPLDEEGLLRLSGRLLSLPLVRSLTFSRTASSHPWADDDPRALACARIVSGGEAWTLELSIWPPPPGPGEELQEP
ncbi:hypothetical protein [Naasia sp. SYSU D00948]|uniref:hypothetical protein n=1 Tax=Naasia sp. SYSU D00948 TaxID=2817379 RepID=UPI001B307B14|nr:hypothetical protein [Naasia sp. SYSU D00948]